MLRVPYFYRYRNSQYIQFFKSVLDVLETYNPDTLHLREPFDKLKSHYETMKTVFVTARGNVMTSEIESQDDNRDSSYIGLKSVILAYLRHFDEAKINAATELYAHLKKYGKQIVNLEYNAETAVLQDIIDGIEENAELSAHTQTLGIDDWFAKLKESNDEFNRLYQVRTKSESEKTKLRLSELRTEGDKLYQMLTDFFYAASLMHPDDVFTQAENELNEYIDQYNAAHKKPKDNNGEDADDL